MILNIKVLLTVLSAIGLAAAQAECHNDNDCPGSEVCCSANFGEGGQATLCIAQSDCVNGGCFESFGGRMAEGSCDGG
ncbi:hypothetical protein BDN70DRAFT_934766 [Pholiota conissans]|uniref:WAP domain-containing protein n=1 Tax=Pholiota conissans TaxID=109636 RepID=A0A9P5YW32_9AGAR|nr:hypothetical protein BDN70DRAFT_934766 [Pholiota conissans]